MGRQRTLTDAERQERQHKLNQKTATRRKEQYDGDVEYREFARGSSRATYRRKSGLALRNLRNAHDFLPSLSTLGSVRDLLTKKGGEALTFSIRELAVLLGGYHPNVIRQWCRDGRFPSPTIEAKGARKELVYSQAQAKALAEIIGTHQQEKSYLSAADTAVISSLFSAFSKTK